MTRFFAVEGTPEGITWLFREPREAVALVSRHGLGDNVFVSPCFGPLAQRVGRVFLGSAVNAYLSLFHESPLVTPLYAGGTNANDLGLVDARSFADHYQALGLDLGVDECFVYHFGLFEVALPYTDPRAFVKGRRNIVEMGFPAPAPSEVPRYHVAPDQASRTFVDAVLSRWLPDRELVAVARYGHTDAGKNFGHDYRDTLALIDAIEAALPGRYKFLGLDYAPGGTTADGHRRQVRSVYGFLPCDSGALHHALSRARLLVTVPTGPMLVGATIPSLRMLTLWKEAVPFHFLDPQHPARVWALVERSAADCREFMAGWEPDDSAAVNARWTLVRGAITPDSVARCAIRILNGVDDVPDL